MNDIQNHKQELIDALESKGFIVNPTRADLSIISVTGKNLSITCNIKTTRHKRTVGELDEIWFDFSENVLNEVDLIILLPLDTLTFYAIPSEWLLTNRDMFFNTREGVYSFHLIFSEERLVGLKNHGYIDLNGTYCILSDRDLLEMNLLDPELPRFPLPFN